MDDGFAGRTQFEEHRPHLRAVAYRMLGSLSRGRRRRAGGVAPAAAASDADERRQPRRLADHRRRPGLPRHAALAARPGARSRSTPTCPTRIVQPATGADPEQEAVLADSVGLALLVVLETLAPAERLAFVLHDMFAVPFDEIAPILVAHARPRRGSSPAAPAAGCRARAAPDARSGPGSARSSTRSSPPRAAATSTRWSRCSTRTSCCAPTRAAAARCSCAAPPRSPGRRSCSRSSARARHRRVAGQRRAAASSPQGRPAGGGAGRAPSSDGRIVEIDILADPQRLAALDLALS